jgi:hypothetical protein
MPHYTGKCTECDKIHGYHSSIKDRNNCPQWCECGGSIVRDVEEELKQRRENEGSAKQVTDNERWSLSMGVPLSQVAEYKKRFPHHVLNDKGHLQIKGYSDKKRKMKERGFVQYGPNETPWKQ